MNLTDPLGLLLINYLIAIFLVAFILHRKKIKGTLFFVFFQAVLLSLSYFMSTQLKDQMVSISDLIEGIMAGVLLTVIVILALVSFGRHHNFKSVRPTFTMMLLGSTLLYFIVKAFSAFHLFEALVPYAEPVAYLLLAMGATVAVLIKARHTHFI